MANDLSLLARATLRLYGDCALKATRSLVKCWRVVPGAIALYLVYQLFLVLVSPIPGPTPGFLLGILIAFLLTCFYGWLRDISGGRSLPWRSLPTLDFQLFSDLISVGFILFLIEFAAQLLSGGGLLFIKLGVALLVSVLFNAVAETVYLRGMSSTPALSHSANFVKENWVEWFLPFILFLTPFAILVSSSQPLLLALVTTEPLLPMASVVQPWLWVGVLGAGFAPILAGLVAVVLGTWFMLFRAYLFTALDSSSRRQRIHRMRG